jgi:hypothetical protein
VGRSVRRQHGIPVPIRRRLAPNSPAVTHADLRARGPDACDLPFSQASVHETFACTELSVPLRPFDDVPLKYYRQIADFDVRRVLYRDGARPEAQNRRAALRHRRIEYLRRTQGLGMSKTRVSATSLVTARSLHLFHAPPGLLTRSVRFPNAANLVRSKMRRGCSAGIRR